MLPTRSLDRGQKARSSYLIDPPTTTFDMSPIQPSKPHEGSNGVEDPATVRRTFIWLALAATVMLLPPRQWVSAGIMGVVTLGLFVWHMWKQGKAEDAKKAEAAKAAEAAKQAAAAAAAAPQATGRKKKPGVGRRPAEVTPTGKRRGRPPKART